MDRISICCSNFARLKMGQFFHLTHLVTIGEKWIEYKRVVRKNAYVHKEEASLSAFNHKGVQMVEYSQTADFFSSGLDKPLERCQTFGTNKGNFILD